MTIWEQPEDPVHIDAQAQQEALNVEGGNILCTICLLISEVGAP
jgi:hypothetical protein